MCTKGSRVVFKSNITRRYGPIYKHGSAAPNANTYSCHVFVVNVIGI